MNGESNGAPRYFCGYPRRHLREVVKLAIGYVAFLSIFLGLSGIGAFLRMQLFLDAGAWSDLVWGLICAAVFLFFAWTLISGLREISIARIVPYFHRRTGVRGLGSFKKGAALARNCRMLDGIAAGAGVPPLSAFGFEDDLAGEAVTWHSPAAGIATIERLLSIVEDEDIRSDLEAVLRALWEARKQDILFALILRNGTDGFLSPGEMDRRAGSFW